MSPIAFPDLLEDRGDVHAIRGRRHSSGRLVSTALRSRSRSRSRSRAQRRSASCRPMSTERTRSAEEKLADKKKRRSLSKPPNKPPTSKEHKSWSNRSEVIDLAQPKGIKKTKTLSPATARLFPTTSKSDTEDTSSGKSKSKDWSADIINLVDIDRDEEQVLLSEIISGKNPAISPTRHSSTKPKTESKMPSKMAAKARSSSRPRKIRGPCPNENDSALSKKETSAADPSSPSKNTVSNASTGGYPKVSPKSVVGFPSSNHNVMASHAYSNDELYESEWESESEDEEEETNSVATKDLLDQVKSRMEQQRLIEEVKDLRLTIEKKDAEIEQLTGQLRMAISTKCDLVIAHTELERLHEMDLKQRDDYAEAMKRSNMSLMEVRAEVEKEFMNELNNLSAEVREKEQQRRKEAAEKDSIIHLMEEKIRRMEVTAMGGFSVRRESDKVKYYKKKLGVYSQ